MRHIFLYFCVLCCSIANSQVIRCYNLEVSCKSRTYNSTQSILDFKWAYRAPAVDTQRVYRKLKNDYFWGSPYKVIRDYDSTFSDTITTGSSYEYKFEKDFGYDDYTVLGYIHAGHRVPSVMSRGKILMIADSTHKTFLDTALRTFRNDLIGDGWTTELKWFDSTTSVAAIKAYIVGRYNADPNNVKSVVLIGNLAVPYSGDYSASGLPPPDGHTTSSGPSHEGAWPADCYYGDMVNPTWPDSTVTNNLGARSANNNNPSDGKFDYSEIPGYMVQLQVGRIDLADLPAFSQSERELLKRYFTKNHNFRHKLETVRERCLIDDNYGVIPYSWPNFYEHFGGNAWRNMAPLISDTVTRSLDFLSTLKTNDYLWCFGMGAGTYRSCAGVAHTDSLAQSSRLVKSVFGGFTGSYFCDWDNSNNLLRALLASRGNMLNTFNVGRPHWYFHHMGLGETIGYSTMRTQSNIDTAAFQYLYPTTAYFNFSIHVALLGDPSVRMQPVEPPHAIQTRQDSCNLRFKIRWTASSDTAVHTYYVLRAKHIDSTFTLLGNTQNLYYVDNSPLSGDNVYMVRGEKLQVSGSGTYFNLSQGIFDTISTTEFSIPVANAGSDTSVCREQQISIGVNSSNNSRTTFSWNPGGFTTNVASMTALTSGNRVLTATDTFTGCIKRDTMAITILPTPVAETINPVTNQCSDTVTWSSTLNNGGGYNYGWTFQGATSFDTSGHMLNSPGQVIYSGVGTYQTRLRITDTVSNCFHTDTQLVFVTCISLPLRTINLNCINTVNGHQIKFIVYENEKYKSYAIEGLLGGQWQVIKVVEVHAKADYIVVLDGKPDYTEIRITGHLKQGESIVLDNCSWQNQLNEISIYPNPVLDRLQLNYSGSAGNKRCLYSVYNSMGIELMSQPFSFIQNNHSINTSQLPVGVYLIRISIGAQDYTYKFVKE